MALSVTDNNVRLTSALLSVTVIHMTTHYHFVYRILNRNGYQVSVCSMLTFTHRMEAARKGAKVFEAEKISLSSVTIPTAPLLGVR